MQTEARSRRLQEVKLEILHKLGLSQAPNVTIKDLPRIPPLQNLLGDDISDDYYNQEDDDDEQMAADMPSSAPSYSSAAHHSSVPEFEDFYVNTEKSISFAKLREFNVMSLFRGQSFWLPASATKQNQNPGRERGT